MADREIKVTVQIINKAKKGLSDISNDTKKASKELKEMDKQTGKSKKQLSGLEGQLKKLAVGYLSFKTLQLGVREFSDALKSASIEQAFHRMADAADIASGDLVNSLRSASRNTIATTDIMLSANRAMALGVGKNLEDMTTLMEIARVKGQAMGLTTTQAFDNIVTGIGRSSPLILDNLGIVIKQNEAQELYAAKLGKSAEALTDAEKRQAIFNAVLDRGKEELAQLGDVQLTPIERQQQLNALWSDAKDQLFRGLIPSFVDLQTELVGATEDTEDYNEVMKTASHIGFVLGKTLESIARVAMFMGDALSGTGKLATAVIQKTTAGFLTMGRIIPGVSDEMATLAEEMNKLADESMDKAIDKGADIKESFAEIGETIFEGYDGFEDYYNQVLKTAEGTDILTKANEEAAAQQEKNTDELDKFKKAYEDIVDASKTFTFETASDFVTFVNNLRNTQNSNDEYISAAKAGFDGLQKKIADTTQEISDLEKKLDDAKKSFDDFVASTTEDSSRSMAQIIFDAEQSIPDLQKQISDAMSSGGGDRVSELRQQLREQKDILKTARQAEYKDNETLQEELDFLREQSGRNELEQITALTTRKIEQRRSEYEKEVEIINQQIAARENEKTVYEEIQKATTLVLTQNVQARLGQINSELGATRSLTAALSSLLAMYQAVRAVQSGGGSGSSTTTPRRAMGGAVSAGRSYVVGENGPEVFTPNSSGAVVPPSNNVRNEVNIYNPVVKSDADKEELIREIKSALSRDDELYTLGAQ